MTGALKLKCKFCDSVFSSERILTSHMCVQKQREKDKDSAVSRIAFYAYNEMYRLTTRAKKPKKFADFSGSRLYIPFIKFSRGMIALGPINLEEYIHFLIKNGIKIKNWTEDEAYLQFVSEFLMLEPPLIAFERSIVFIGDWASQHGIKTSSFFARVSPAEAVTMIQGGRISPWVLYLSASSNSLIDSFTEEQTHMIRGTLDPKFWTDRIAAKREDARFIGQTLHDAGF